MNESHAMSIKIYAEIEVFDGMAARKVSSTLCLSATHIHVQPGTPCLRTVHSSMSALCLRLCLRLPTSHFSTPLSNSLSLPPTLLPTLLPTPQKVATITDILSPLLQEEEKEVEEGATKERVEGTRIVDRLELSQRQ